MLNAVDDLALDVDVVRNAGARRRGRADRFDLEISDALDPKLIVAAFMPFSAFTNASYFTLRSGGKTVITFLFDCVFLWTINIPLAMILVYLTDLPILPLYACIQSVELIKVVLGYILLKRRSWVNNLVEKE